MFNYQKLREEWRRNGYSNKDIAKKIGMHEQTLSKKYRGELPLELSATEVAIICGLIESPMDMFIERD